MIKKLAPLVIGDLKIKLPIIQGGMGVKVSTAALAGAVAICGGAGTIAGVGLAYDAEDTEKNYVEVSNQALRSEIKKTRKTTDGVFGVNIMVALSNYEELVRVASSENVDFIVSGAGLPLKLPEFVENNKTKLIPIVSSGRSAEVIFKTWKRRYSRLPDAVVVEGPLAGGHLGFKAEDLINGKADKLEKILADVLCVIKKYNNNSSLDIPVIVAGGIFDGKDIAKFLRLGAKGVQLGTRFVATEECAVSRKFKELYVAAEEKDLTIIKSPVGMPGRSIRTEFIKRIRDGEKVKFKCGYRCLRTCDVLKTQYCIAKAMCNSMLGDFNNAIAFAGANVYRVKNIPKVKTLIDELTNETIKELNKA